MFLGFFYQCQFQLALSYLPALLYPSNSEPLDTRIETAIIVIENIIEQAATSLSSKGGRANYKSRKQYQDLSSNKITLPSLPLYPIPSPPTG